MHKVKFIILKFTFLWTCRHFSGYCFLVYHKILKKQDISWFPTPSPSSIYSNCFFLPNLLYSRKSHPTQRLPCLPLTFHSLVLDPIPSNISTKLCHHLFHLSFLLYCHLFLLYNFYERVYMFHSLWSKDKQSKSKSENHIYIYSSNLTSWKHCPHLGSWVLTASPPIYYPNIPSIFPITLLKVSSSLDLYSTIVSYLSHKHFVWASKVHLVDFCSMAWSWKLRISAHQKCLSENRILRN